jgi:filamentous hemagglutinin family protein
MIRNRSALLRTILMGSCCLAVIAGSPARSQPTGGTVVAGRASITSAGALSTTVNQTTNKALIDWQSFSIAAGGTVQFNQLDASSITLNRVIGPESSSIFGSLLANGQVWLINQNGILFGKGSVINVGGLLATTSDIADGDFMSGNYSFSSASGASIVNQGAIRTANGGSAVLSAARVSNEGLIEADAGTVVLGGASAFTVDFDGDNLLRYAIAAPAAKASDGNSGAFNSGSLIDAGGRVLMTARAAANIADAVVNNTGMISATSAHLHNGEVVLDAGNGTVKASGTIDASGVHAGEAGGTVTITGKNVVVADNTQINVSGDQGGGTVRIGGDLHGAGSLQNADNTDVGSATIDADAISAGRGGTLVVWSNGITDFSGIFSARGGASGGDGGFAETSGRSLNVASTARVDTRAFTGKTGTWLLDPTDILIEPLGTDGIGGSDMSASTVVNALGTSNVTLEATHNITVDDPLSYNSPNTLNLLAVNDIDVNASIQNSQSSGGGAINFIAGWDGSTLPPASLTASGVYGNGGSVNLGGASAGGDVLVGTRTGTLTIAATNVSLEATNGNVQLGFQGAATGNINVLATGDVSLDGQSPGGFYAQIGNGAMNSSVFGAVGGNISVTAGGAVHVSTNAGLPCDCSGANDSVFIGNMASTDSPVPTGNAVVIGSDINDNGDAITGGFGHIVATDLAAGDVTVGGTNPANPIDIKNGFGYDSPHTLMVLSAGDLTIEGTIQNAGSGNMMFVAGWKPSVAPANVLTTPGSFGNNNALFGIGGPNATGDVSVGSHGGTTTVLSYDADVFGTVGYAQLGYHGAGGGDINMTTLHDLSMTSYAGYAMIGNGSLNGDVSGDVSGNIDLHVTGNVHETDTVDQPIFYGNATADGSETGNLTFVMTDNDGSSHDALGNSIKADIVGGDVTLGFTGTGDQGPNHDYPVDSTHTLNLLVAGNLVMAGSILNSGTGAINLVGGWDGHTLTPASFGNAGVFGNNGHTVTIGGGTAASNVAVGSAGGTTSVYGAALDVAAGGGYAQLGFHGSGTGAIFVDVTGGITVAGGGNGNPFQYAQIGNGGAQTSGNNGGDISLTAGGDLTLQGGAAAGAYAQIGHGGAQSNVGGNGYSNVAPITISAANVVLVAGNGAQSYVQIGNGGYKSGAGLLGGTATNGGDISVTSTGTVSLRGGLDDSYAQIGNGGSQSNLNPAAAASGADTGNIVVAAGPAGSVTVTAGAGANAYAQIGNGGYSINAGPNATVANFTVTGNVSVSDLGLYGGNGGANAYAQIGNGDLSLTGFGNVSGDITIAANGNIVLTNGSAPDSKAGIGNFIGQGTSNGTVDGVQPPPSDVINDPAVQGVIVSQASGPPDISITTLDTEVLPVPPDANPGAAGGGSANSGAPGPIAELSGGDGTSGNPSDGATIVIADSFNGAGKPPISQSILAGLLTQVVPTGAGQTVHGVPPADQDFSSWGNEALWQ